MASKNLEMYRTFALLSIPGSFEFCKAYEVEGRSRRFDGEFRLFLFRGSPLRDRSGNVAKWYGTIPISRSGSVLKMLSEQAKHLCSMPNG